MGHKKDMSKIVTRPPSVHVAALMAAELHHGHTFAKLARIPAGTRTYPVKKRKDGSLRM